MSRLKPENWDRLVKLFEREGWKVARKKGDHVTLQKPGAKRPLVLRMKREVDKHIIRNCLKEAGISLERYFELLRKV